MKKFTWNELEDLALGSAILGSGGGGDPAYDLLMTKYILEKNGPVDVISLEELNSEDLVVPLAFMGAPLVCMESLSSGREFSKIMALIESTLGKKAAAVMPAEIGGSNAFIPIRVAGELGIPLLDADTIGRAFPELQMSSCYLHGIRSPAFLADSLGNVAVLHAQDSPTMENIARHICVAMGSNAAIAIYLMEGLKAQKSVIPGSLSRAVEIGRAIREAKQENRDPIQALLQKEKGQLLGSGKITDVNQTVTNGFLNGTVHISNPKQTLEVAYQNEYLLAKEQNQVLATTPDIIMLLEEETAAPITSECLRYGTKVHLVALPGPDLWKTPEGLALVGPGYFGYDVVYKGI